MFESENKIRKEIIDILINIGEGLSNYHGTNIPFTEEEEVDKILNDLDNFPHFYVLACIMDKQIKAERAWKIPYLISQWIEGYEFEKFLSLDHQRTKEYFNQKKLHRYNNDMAECFYRAIQKLHLEYNNDASLIWKGKPTSGTIVRRFLQFYGVGVKIASMATNILARDFKIPMQDKICIDISPDVQAMRVCKRLGFISHNSKNEELVYLARELNPKYPGVFDLPVWEIGREWCYEKNPLCNECKLSKVCPRIMN